MDHGGIGDRGMDKGRLPRSLFKVWKRGLASTTGWTWHGCESELMGTGKHGDGDVTSLEYEEVKNDVCSCLHNFCLTTSLRTKSIQCQLQSPIYPRL